MTKPKISPHSKYVENNPRAKKVKVIEKTLAEQAQEFLASGTPASYVTQVVLAVAIFYSLPFLGAIAPGFTIPTARRFRRSEHYSEKQIWDAKCSLKRGGFIEEVFENNKKPRIKVTKKGEEYFKKILFEDVQLPEPKIWGGKWTFVVFDIPIGNGKAREALRWRLKALGFYQYQKSVWAYPHPCEKEILFVADYFGVGRFVEIFSVDHVSNDKDLKKHFKIK